MADKFTYDFRQLLTAFQETWAQLEAFRIQRTIEAAGESANWEETLKGARALAQDIFQPALSDLDNQSPPSLVLEGLLERLAKPRK